VGISSSGAVWPRLSAARRWNKRPRDASIDALLQSRHGDDVASMPLAAP